ncbi:MAG TPA: Gfo/Idh/MocA family oxidoreductase [Candidatus Saccharimonadales bacterium]|nr:Gfo/Idh/MocA family oxidoreductase [Candidatus Saccharimonadales bacterium]
MRSGFTSRRRFLQSTAVSSFGLLMTGHRAFSQAGTTTANDKLNIGVIGVANQGGYNLSNVSSQNIVALCDVDDKFLNAAAQKHPGAKTYNDFRKLLDQQGIDAVVVATPDHTHAVATMAALKSGRDVYCEKPLTHTISECRLVTETARKLKRVTQIGTQIHAGGNYRRVVELIQSGAIGKVRDVHVWVAATYGGKDWPKESSPVPENLHYDLWLGPVPEKPYSKEWVPFAWRNWWAFGGGALADFGCHFMDLPFWALDLKYPLSVEAEGPALHPDSTPPWLIVRYTYPQRKELPAVNLTWYHGGKRPEALLADIFPPKANEAKAPKQWPSGVLFLGEKGMVLSDYSNHMLLPEDQFAGFERPKPFIKDSIGHHKEWIEACKNRGTTTCQFDYSGPLTESALLGNVAFRVGRKLQWDPETLKAKNSGEADQYIQHVYRKGWSI